MNDPVVKSQQAGETNATDRKPAEYRIFNFSDTKVSLTFKTPNSNRRQPPEVIIIDSLDNAVLPASSVEKDSQITIEQTDTGVSNGTIMIQFSEGLSPFKCTFDAKGDPGDGDAQRRADPNNPPDTP